MVGGAQRPAEVPSYPLLLEVLGPRSTRLGGLPGRGGPRVAVGRTREVMAILAMRLLEDLLGFEVGC